MHTFFYFALRRRQNKMLLSKFFFNDSPEAKKILKYECDRRLKTAKIGSEGDVRDTAG